jgi:methylated-DNA-[protein]-cysteine S-methyltransferase
MKSYMYLKTKMHGDLLLVANSSHLIGVYFSNQPNGPKLSADWKMEPVHAILKQAGKELHEYLAGKRADFSVPIAFDGTEFQREIWKQIARIPFGKTISYTELARRAGAPKATRAVGTATGRNPLGIIIPCHRVVGKDGGLGGYAGGLDRKKSLLNIETCM